MVHGKVQRSCVIDQSNGRLIRVGICNNCGQIFHIKNADQKYCCVNCREAYYYKKKKERETT